jgi:MFS transporter, ACS family, glucarate transporter
MSDTAPKKITGFAGGVFNMCGNLSSIVIGYIIVAANALLAAFRYLVIVARSKRMVLVK